MGSACGDAENRAPADEASGRKEVTLRARPRFRAPNASTLPPAPLPSFRRFCTALFASAFTFAENSLSHADLIPRHLDEFVFFDILEARLE